MNWLTCIVYWLWEPYYIFVHIYTVLKFIRNTRIMNSFTLVILLLFIPVLWERERERERERETCRGSRSEAFDAKYTSLLNFKDLLYPPQTKFRGVYWFHHVRPSVSLSVCLSVVCGHDIVHTCCRKRVHRFFWKFVCLLISVSI